MELGNSKMEEKMKKIKVKIKIRNTEKIKEIKL
jgi:hypothetical protein